MSDKRETRKGNYAVKHANDFQCAECGRNDGVLAVTEKRTGELTTRCETCRGRAAAGGAAMRLKIVTSRYVEPGKMYVIDPDAGGALADATRVIFDLDDPEHVGVKVIAVATDALKDRLEGFAAVAGIEVVA